VSDSVGERIKFIDSLKFSKEKEPRVMPSGTIPLFGSDLKSTLLIGGRLGSPLKAPFDWDFNYLKKNDILPGKRVLEISPGKDSGDTQVLLPPSLSSISEEDSTKVNCRCDNNFLYITFICEKSDMKEIEEDRFVAVVAPDGTGSRQLQFYLQGKSKLASVRKIDKKSCDNDWKGDIYKDFPSKLKVEVSARQNQNNNSVSIGIAVPLELFDSAKPSLGQTWYGNFLRTRKTPSGDYVWEPNIIRKTWQNKLDELGKITFK
jgi:hypothetical protein